jgi:hypothetical protein
MDSDDPESPDLKKGSPNNKKKGGKNGGPL